MHIHADDLVRIRRVAEQEAQGRRPMVLSELLDTLTIMARQYPQTLLELLRHIDASEPLVNFNEPLVGEQAVCRMCGEHIVYVDPYWQHLGEKQSRHPALPKE